VWSKDEPQEQRRMCSGVDKDSRRVVAVQVVVLHQGGKGPAGDPSAVALAKFPRPIAKQNSVQAEIIPHHSTEAEKVARRTKKKKAQNMNTIRRTAKLIKTLIINFIFNNRMVHGGNSYIYTSNNTVVLVVQNMLCEMTILTKITSTSGG
jgi:hypothetical protein